MGIQEWRLRGRKPALRASVAYEAESVGLGHGQGADHSSESESESGTPIRSLAEAVDHAASSAQTKAPSSTLDSDARSEPVPVTEAISASATLNSSSSPSLSQEAAPRTLSQENAKSTTTRAAEQPEQGVVMPALRPAPVPLEALAPVDLSMGPEPSAADIETSQAELGSAPTNQEPPEYSDADIPPVPDDEDYSGFDAIIDDQAAPAAPMTDEHFAPSDPAIGELSQLDWRALQARISNNTACPSCGQEHSTLGFGDVLADWLFISDAPTSAEIQAQQLFTRRAGELYDAILGACGLTREAVYTSSVFKCAPPEDLSLSPQCDKLIHRQIELIQPKYIIAFGEFSAQAVLRSNDGFDVLQQGVRRYQSQHQSPSASQAQGSEPQKHQAPLVLTSHTLQQLLAQPELKAQLWQALKRVL